MHGCRIAFDEKIKWTDHVHETPEVNYLRKSLALMVRTRCPLATVPTPRHIRKHYLYQIFTYMNLKF